MKNIFTAAVFLAALCLLAPALPAGASVRTFSEANLKAKQANPAPLDPRLEDDPNVPDPSDTRAMKDFVAERLRVAVITEDDDQYGPMSAVPSEEHVKAQKEAGKSFLEKVYESALNRDGGRPASATPGAAAASGSAQAAASAGSTASAAQAEQRQRQAQQEWDALQAADVPTLSVALPPFGAAARVPAVEHIAYFSASLDIAPSGLINVRETIAAVAGGDKVKTGLARAIPKYSQSRDGQRNKIELALESVKINGTDATHLYKVEDSNEAVFISPAGGTKALAPGFYVFEFNYAVDRRLWLYGDFAEFYWDATGSLFSLPVARAGAVVHLPGGADPTSSLFEIGSLANMSAARAIVAPGKGSGTAYIAGRPLMPGEGMHILAAFDKRLFEAPGIGRRLGWFFDDHAAGIIGLLGLAAILAAYAVSWKGLKGSKAGPAGGLKKSAALTRYLAKGGFDKVSFVAFLLELLRKNIVDIQKSASDGEILLVKKTDSLKGLSRLEAKAVGFLFPGGESVLAISGRNHLKISRAYKPVARDAAGGFERFALRLNLGYLAASMAMIAATFGFVAWASFDPWQTFLALAIGEAIAALGIFLILKRKPVWELAGGAVSLFAWFMLGVFSSLFAAICFIAMAAAVFHYTRKFGQRNGLLRAYIEEAEHAGEALLKNRENLAGARAFAAQQANIFALDLADEFPKTPALKDVYRLDLAKEIAGRI